MIFILQMIGSRAMTRYHLYMCAKCLMVRAGPVNIPGNFHFCPVCDSEQKAIDLELTSDGDPRGFLKGEDWFKVQTSIDKLKQNKK